MKINEVEARQLAWDILCHSNLDKDSLTTLLKLKNGSTFDLKSCRWVEEGAATKYKVSIEGVHTHYYVSPFDSIEDAIEFIQSEINRYLEVVIIRNNNVWMVSKDSLMVNYTIHEAE